MGSVRDLVKEGVTAFYLRPATSYRYSIALKNSKLSIWMEDRTSKKQWFKGGMDKTDYISSANAIPDASTANYFTCFKDTLDSDLNASTDAQRELHNLDDGGLRLVLTIKIHVLRSTWVATYTFDLEPVSVERIDILESKLRDQQEQSEKLRNKQKDLEKRCCELKMGDAPSYINLTASKKNGDLILCWNATESEEFESTGLDGVVKTLREGVYNINVIVNTASGTNQYVQLQKNGSAIQVVYPGYSQGYYNSASLDFIERLKKNDELKIMCACDLSNAPSYLTIVRLGN